MSSIAVITARGGSKRIPKKNIKDFCGKPIISYSIKAALEADCFDEVMVSTDSDEIKSVSMEYGASVPFLRSKANSDDYATTADVLVEVINKYKETGKTFDLLACIYPTAPFVTGEKLREAFQVMNERKADSILTVVKYSFPPQRAFAVNDGRVEYIHPEYERTRSQDLEPIYHDCGQFYIIRRETFMNEKSLIVQNTIPFIVDEVEVQDIDTLSDWRIAEAKYRVLYGDK